VACPVDQVDSAQVEPLQQLETELLPATELEIERRSEPFLVGLVVLVGCAVVAAAVAAAAESGTFGSCLVRDFALRKAADVATSVAAAAAVSGIGPDSSLGSWCSQGRQVALPPVTSLHLLAALGNDRDYPRKV
jgi:hypothetical protein